MREIKFRARSGANGEWEYFNINSHNEVRELSYRIEKGWINGLSQFTGLKDKNGKEIYEGDIVKSNDGIDDWYHKVSISAYGVQFDNYTLHDASFKDIKVVGNIFENPELVKN